VIPSAETTMKIEQWRRKIREGTLTVEEAKEIIVHLRGSRASAIQTTKPSTTHKTKTVVDSDDLLKDFL
jgi:hypothetical protein